MKTYILVGWLGLTAAAAYAMFHVGFAVERLEGRIATVEEISAAEREAIHILRAEWSYLNRPDRLAKLAEQLLPHLQPPAAAQIGSINRIPENSDPIAAAVAHR